MSQEILDDLKEKEKPHFGNKSLRMLNAGIGFYFIFILMHLFFWEPFEPGKWMGLIALLAGVFGSICTGLGIIYGAMSVSRIEKGGRKSYLSLIGSVVMFLLMGWLVVGYIYRLILFLIIISE